MGWDCDCVKGGWSELMDDDASGKIDVMGAVSYTPERAQAIPDEKTTFRMESSAGLQVR